MERIPVKTLDLETKRYQDCYSSLTREEARAVAALRLFEQKARDLFDAGGEEDKRLNRKASRIANTPTCRSALAKLHQREAEIQEIKEGTYY